MQKTTLMLAALMLASGLAAQETTISGFADAAYYYDAAEGSGEFGLDQVEIDVIHQQATRPWCAPTSSG